MNNILYHIKPGTSNFFLGDFPDEKYEYSTCKIICDQTGHCSCLDYQEKVQSCKEEAIKNGEIINPELIYLLTKHKINAAIGEWMANFQDGNIFDLPEELSFEKVKYTCNHVKKQNELQYPKSALEFPDCCGDNKTFIHLVPSIRERKKLFLIKH